MKMLYFVTLLVLRGLSPLELSRHAVELEKRAMHLSLEEGTYITKVRNLKDQ